MTAWRDLDSVMLSDPENIIEPLGPTCLQPTYLWAAWLLQPLDFPSAQASLSWFPGPCNQRALTHASQEEQTLDTEEVQNHWQLFLRP